MVMLPIDCPRSIPVLSISNSIETHNDEERKLLPVGHGPAIALVADRQLAMQYLGEEIAVATCRLTKTRVNALGLVLDEIEHGVHLPFGSEHLAAL